MSIPGHREQWDIRPRWHSLVVGNGKLGKGTESVVSPEAKFAYPVTFNEDGALLRSPEGSRFHTITAEMFRRHADKFGPESVRETAAELGVELSRSTVTPARKAPKFRRRTTASLTRDVREMRGRGVVVTAIADSLNISDRRVKELIKG